MESVGFHIQLLNLYPGREEGKEGGGERDERGRRGEREEGRREERELERRGRGEEGGFMKSFGSQEWTKIKSS